MVASETCLNVQRMSGVARLDVEYTLVMEKEKPLKEADMKKPDVIQVYVHNVCLVYHICHADIRCQHYEVFLKDKIVKFVIIEFMNERRVLGRIGLVVGQTFDL